jgi:hypothetical protein
MLRPQIHAHIGNIVLSIGNGNEKTHRYIKELKKIGGALQHRYSDMPQYSHMY